MAFFTANPLGRIVNRFSADQGQVDTLLPIAVFDTLEKGAMALGSVTLGCIAIPWLLLMVPPLCWYLVNIRQFATRSLRELKRLDGTSRSPVQQAFTASLQGLETIRAFGRDTETQATFQGLLETNARAWCADYHLFVFIAHVPCRRSRSLPPRRALPPHSAPPQLPGWQVGLTPGFSGLHADFGVGVGSVGLNRRIRYWWLIGNPMM